MSSDPSRRNERERGSREHRNLPRLDRSYYCGLAQVHWIFTIRDLKPGYLTPEFFLKLQLIATNAFLRYRVVSPCLCFMPDHIHLLLVGHDEEKSDQQLAIRFLTKHLKPTLLPFEFQRPVYDHVLRKSERERDAFQDTANYVIDNPVRAGLVDTATDWPFKAAIIPGYPDINPTQEDFWERFWKIYYRILEPK